jgi:glycerol-3-phosphate O-acyltransferase / dihydroxyacetone phosphate acyltransferase
VNTRSGLIRALARAVVHLFYHRVDVVGIERVPRAGALVIVSNHRNALIDPLILIATLPRALRPLAKAPLFRHPLLAPFMHLAGAVPVHRRADPGRDPAQNGAMFRAVAQFLRDGGAILIFPEGVSQPEPVLMPLRTGVARIVLGTENEAGAWPVTLLPVGLTFHEPGTFRAGWALVVVGAPVPIDDCRVLAVREPERAVRELTARVAEALRVLIVEVGDRETLRLTEGLEAIRRAEVEDTAGADAAGTSIAERVSWIQAAIRAYRWLEPRATARVARLRAEVERYLADLESLGLSAHEVGRAYPPGVARRYALREGLAVVAGLPLAAWGVLSHALPYWLTALAARALTTEADVTATVKVVAGVVFYPVCWAIEAWLVRRILGPWGLAAFLVGLIPSALFALGWQARLERVRRDAWAFLRFLWDRDLLARLTARRRALVDETDALARVVPADVLAGSGASGELGR